MKIVCAFLLLGISLTAFSQSELSKQTEAVNPPFKLEITANLDKEHSYLWDFVNCTETTVKAGSIIVVAVRKTNISDHEILKNTHADRFYVRDSNGNLVGPRHSNEPKMIGSGKGGHLLGTKDNVLQPGENTIDRDHISDGFDIGQPGTYTVQILSHVANDPNSDVVKSNIITITVVPPDPPADEPK